MKRFIFFSLFFFNYSNFYADTEVKKNTPQSIQLDDSQEVSSSKIKKRSVVKKRQGIALLITGTLFILVSLLFSEPRRHSGDYPITFFSKDVQKNLKEVLGDRIFNVKRMIHDGNCGYQAGGVDLLYELWKNIKNPEVADWLAKPSSGFLSIASEIDDLKSCYPELNEHLRLPDNFEEITSQCCQDFSAIVKKGEHILSYQEHLICAKWMQYTLFCTYHVLDFIRKLEHFFKKDTPKERVKNFEKLIQANINPENKKCYRYIVTFRAIWNSFQKKQKVTWYGIEITGANSMNDILMVDYKFIPKVDCVIVSYCGYGSLCNLGVWGIVTTEEGGYYQFRYHSSKPLDRYEVYLPPECKIPQTVKDKISTILRDPKTYDRIIAALEPDYIDLLVAKTENKVID